MAINTELLERVMQHILDHPEQHDQTSWGHKEPHCGTAACFAGWTVILAGERVRFDQEQNMFLNHSHRDIPTRAAELLGLPFVPGGGMTLFRTPNTIPVLQLMVKDLVNDGKLHDDPLVYEEMVDRME